MLPKTSAAITADEKTEEGSSFSFELVKGETKIEGVSFQAVQMSKLRAESGGEGIRTPDLLRVRETS